LSCGDLLVVGILFQNLILAESPKVAAQLIDRAVGAGTGKAPLGYGPLAADPTVGIHPLDIRYNSKAFGEYRANGIATLKTLAVRMRTRRQKNSPSSSKLSTIASRSLLLKAERISPIRLSVTLIFPPRNLAGSGNNTKCDCLF
jgi:hypothetical protein